MWMLLLVLGCGPRSSDVIVDDSGHLPGDDDGDGYTADDGDCSPFDPAVHPGADDAVGDAVDQDCDGVDGVDGDGDGAASEDSGGDDCDDDDDMLFPGADEVCNDIDDDCDGEIDEDAVDAVEWWVDVDGDGYGSPLESTRACSQPDGFVDNDEDCEDGQAEYSPDVDEVCDDSDNDCDGLVDADDPDLESCLPDTPAPGSDPDAPECVTVDIDCATDGVTHSFTHALEGGTTEWDSERYAQWYCNPVGDSSGPERIYTVRSNAGATVTLTPIDGPMGLRAAVASGGDSYCGDVDASPTCENGGDDFDGVQTVETWSGGDVWWIIVDSVDGTTGAYSLDIEC